MKKFIKDFKHYKLVTNILVLLLILVGIGGLFYYKTQITETCEKKLESYSANHLCISTSYGLMVFELYPESAPKAVERIKKLANEDKFYDGLEFYRIVNGFVAQGGIQDYATRLVSNNIDDANLKSKIDKLGTDTFSVETNFANLGLTAEQITQLENDGYKSDTALKVKKFQYGTLSFANNGPDGNSSEFYIITNKNADDENVKALNGKFSNVGEIIEGKDVLEKINNAERNLNYPLEFSNDQTHPAKKIEIFEMRGK